MLEFAVILTGLVQAQTLADPILILVWIVMTQMLQRGCSY